jgi:hypothetical protein
MSDTGKQIKHETVGMAEKAAGSVAGSGGLKEEGDEHLEEAAELDEAFEKSRAGTTKDTATSGSPLRDHLDRDD